MHRGADNLALSFCLIWRGNGIATLRNLDRNRDDTEQIIQVHRGQRLQMSEVAGRWQILVPSHTVAISIGLETTADQLENFVVELSVDAEFAIQNNGSAIDLPFGSDCKTNRRAIEIVDNKIRQPDRLNPHNYAATPIHSDDENTASLSINELPNTHQLVELSDQNIDVYCGEDIILSTYGLFNEHMGSDANFVSAGIPDWLFLDRTSGEILGTVPINLFGQASTSFIVYAADDLGNSAKTTIIVTYHKSEMPNNPDLADFQFFEGAEIILETENMFNDFGLDPEDTIYTATGLPNGLQINDLSGQIRGVIAEQSANSEPYQIVVSVAESGFERNRFSLSFLAMVRKPEAITTRYQDVVELMDCSIDQEQIESGTRINILQQQSNHQV